MPPVYAIAVMGITGVGKSTFIERVVGKESVKIGHGLQSGQIEYANQKNDVTNKSALETSEVSGHTVSIQGKEYMLIDTPGFDDTHLSDADVLKMIAEWLVSSYRSGTKLSAILYVHAITETRMQGTALRNIRMFKELCGEKFYENITFGTSCWSLIEHDKAVEREEELKSHPRFWKPMLDLGSKLVRLPDSREAARDLITQIANHEAAALRIQEEIVDEGVPFEQASATKAFEAECDELRKEHEAQIRALKLEQARLAEEAEQRRLRALREAQEATRKVAEAALQARLEFHRSKRNCCRKRKPFGKCDKCKSDLSNWDIIYHCCSCRDDDLYWHCCSCGPNCGNPEHPEMSYIDTSCTVM